MAREIIDLLSSPVQNEVIELLSTPCTPVNSRRPREPAVPAEPAEPAEQAEPVEPVETQATVKSLFESLLNSPEHDSHDLPSPPAQQPSSPHVVLQPAPRPAISLVSSPPRASNFSFGLDSSPSPVRKRSLSPVSPLRSRGGSPGPSLGRPAKVAKRGASRAQSGAASRTKSAKTSAPKLSKITRDRNQTVKELQVTIAGTVHNLVDLLDEAGVATTASTLNPVEGLTAVLTIERKTTSHWDPLMRAYIEGQEHTVVEPVKILVLDAQLSPVFTDSTAALEQLDAAHGSQCLYVAEGYGKLLKKQINAYNRMLQKRTRNAIKNITAEVDSVPPPDAAGFMQKQVQLEVVHKRRLVYCEKPSDTLEWIVDMLKDISMKRYLNKAFVNINPSDVKSQKDPKLIATEALCQLPRATKRIAESLEEQFASLGDMVANSHTKSLALSESLRTMLDRFVVSTNPDEII